jgi:hypothetical protein
MSAEKLTKNQQRLRGKKISDMTDDELTDWLAACHKMEVLVKFKKARHSWVEAGKNTQAEISRRNADQVAG